ncbi:hypothetical protein [Rhodococcus sp. IEGM 1379]|uniref:hypothetical protein n=1 Tax=Rhodococcus sp. IEGM 1379 TaxID=3047086 RepID=UPI0024B6C851|nr:hypothetical protein [Rhodococcus sp. IEGM 1379]MDI9913799.1 hypothetical protein [Rhodococcus sp. IEGM 1379]
MNTSTQVTNAGELAEALASGAREIHIVGTIAGSPMITVPPGVTLRGGVLKFGAKGIRVTSDNTLDGMTVMTADDEVAILNDTSIEDMGTLTLRNVRTVGQVLLLADDAVRAGHVQVDGLHIDRADVRGRSRRPHGFGVEALQGALTIWNRQPDPAVIITAEVLDVSVGTESTPVRGSGIFVGGHGDWDGMANGGILRVSHLRTGEIHTNGGIPEATPDLISGGVFVISGAVVEQVTNIGPVTTYGQNDMVLDNWGDVAAWTATAPVTSNGPSGIGFVNFGNIDRLDVKAPIQTNGKGARGFNLYDGSLREANFAGVSTTGDGSVGIQISKPLGTLSVSGDVTTSGGEGLSLVKGVQVVLKAVGLSIKSGGEVGNITIGGRIKTSGDGVNTVEIEGLVNRLEVGGGISASGKGSDAVHVVGNVSGLDTIELSSADGYDIIGS